MKRLGLLFVIGYAVSGGVAHAATYYVAKTGSNSNSCTQAQSTSTPKLTINAGIGCLSAGDTLLVRGGDYDEGISSIPSGASWSNKVRIANYPGETVWMRPLIHLVGNPGEVVRITGNEQYIEFDGINMDGRNVGYGTFDAISAAGVGDPNHIRIQNAEIIARSTDNSAYSAWGQWGIGVGGHSASTIIGGNEIINMTIHGGGRPGTDVTANGYGIYVMGPNNRVENCNIYDNSAATIQIYNADGASPDNNIIRNNRLHDITRSGNPTQVWGIIISGRNNQFYNNIVYNIGVGGYGDGIFVYAGSGHRIYNNTVVNSMKFGINLNASASGTEVKNNIVYASGGSNFADGGVSTALSNNLFGIDPLFVNPSANDFQLQATSRAVDAGTGLSTVTSDFAGVARPQGAAPDIGAYEYRAQQAQSSAPAPPTGVRIVSN